MITGRRGMLLPATGLPVPLEAQPECLRSGKEYPKKDKNGLKLHFDTLQGCPHLDVRRSLPYRAAGGER